MKKSFAILAVLILSGLIGALFFINKKPPSIPELRNDPSLFQFNDYDDKIALHTRLSTLFPRGATQDDVIKFFNAANLSKTDETFYECTHKLDFNNASFIFDFTKKTLLFIQVDDWPKFQELCKGRVEIPVDEKPVVLPLMPLPGSE